MKPYQNEVQKVTPKIASFFNSAFTKITIDGPKLDPAKIQEQPLMAISTHRSHVDYFLLGHKLFVMGFQNLRFAAGDNLTKLPWIGPKFLNFGAFTVSRDTGFERNYVRNLCSSVVKMMDGGDSIIVFPEGGRSYSGATIEMKGGITLAAIMLQAQSPQKTVQYLPTAISYECIPDLPYFKMLLKGKKLRKRGNSVFKRLMGNIYYFGGDICAFVPFLNAKRLHKNYGEVFIDYLAPIAVKDILDIEGNRQVNSRDEFSAHRVSMQQFSDKLFVQLKSLYRLLPMHAVSSVLKESNTLSLHDCRDKISELTDSISKLPYNLKTLSTLTSDQILEQGITQLQRFKAISADHGIISIKKPEIVSYFSASIDNKGA
jgi:1-acyl-sn-glycerol-3-phosphate acyltransferase